MEYSLFFKYFGFLDNWVGRGLYIIFCGALLNCLDEYHLVTSPEGSNHPRFHSDIFETLRSIITLMLYTCGLLYSSLGLLCIKSLKMRELTIIRKKKQAVIQATKLKEHKYEIEKLLQETESRLQGV